MLPRLGSAGKQSVGIPSGIHGGFGAPADNFDRPHMLPPSPCKKSHLRYPQSRHRLA